MVFSKPHINSKIMSYDWTVNYAIIPFILEISVVIVYSANVYMCQEKGVSVCQIIFLVYLHAWDSTITETHSSLYLTSKPSTFEKLNVKDKCVICEMLVVVHRYLI